MIENRSIDEILTGAFRKNDIAIKELAPDFSRVEQGALLKYRQRSKKHRTILIVRVAAIVVVSLLLVNGLMLLTDVKPVQAYRTELRNLYFNLFNNDPSTVSGEPIKRMSTKLSSMQSQVPFKIKVPGWIPPGYQFSDVRMTGDGNGIFVVNLEYAFSSGKKADMLFVSETNDDSYSYTSPSPDETSPEKITVNGCDFYLFESTIDDSSHFSGIFYDKNGLFFTVSCAIDKQSFLKLIESIG